MMFLFDSANYVGQAFGLLPGGWEKERDFNALIRAEIKCCRIVANHHNMF